MKLEWLWEALPVLCKIARVLTKKSPKPVTFLIVEDDANDAELLSIQLRRRGISSERVPTAEAAEVALRHQHYPIVFVDLRLPTVSGTSLLHTISRDAPRVNCVVVCGEAYDLKDIPRSKFISVIQKPATLEAIEEMLQKLKTV